MNTSSLPAAPGSMKAFNLDLWQFDAGFLVRRHFVASTFIIMPV